MQIHLFLFCLRILFLTEHATHGEMMSTVGDRYTPRTIAETVRRPRMKIGAYLATYADTIRSFFQKLFS